MEHYDTWDTITHETLWHMGQYDKWDAIAHGML